MTTEENHTETLQGDRNEGEVLATVYNFNRFKIRQFIYQEITILEVIGEFDPTMGKKLERQAAQIRNNLGLDLSGVVGLQSNIISSLQRIHKKLHSRNKCFLLCNEAE